MVIKKIIFFLSFALTLLIGIYGQNDVLVIKNIKSGKHKIILQNQNITISCFNSRIYRGKLNIVNDSAIKVGNNIIRLNNIEEIEAKPALKIILGAFLLTGGLIVTPGGIILSGYGILALSLISNQEFGSIGYIGVPLIIGGLFITGIGIAIVISGIKFICRPQIFKIYDWDFNIQDYYKLNTINMANPEMK